jgi:glyoxylase-like metal-dependent hydrolase (beta-lactamase superfamily II)
MADLASKKVRSGDVDVVFLSHLHLDHVGWNTTNRGGRWVPTFPNARYICHQADLDHFRKPEVEAVQTYRFMHMFVEPLVEAGRLDAVTGDMDLTAEVKAVHTPGHTPGHMSVLVTSGGQRANIQGDVLIHPAQVTEETWNCRFDVDWDVANLTRRKLLDQVEAGADTVISCHFPAPGFGRVVRSQGRRYWQVGL